MFHLLVKRSVYAACLTSASLIQRQAGSPTPDLSTPSGSSTKQAIGQTYGQTLAKDLLTVKVSSKEDDDGDEVMEDDEEEWSAEAHFSGPNYQAKKTVFLLFINRTCIFYAFRKYSLNACILLPISVVGILKNKELT